MEDGLRIVSAGSSSPYKPLTSLDDIRLLLLLPASANRTLGMPTLEDAESSIVCETRHVGLSSRPRYEALSYMWGSKQADFPIILNGQPFYIRSNLQAALHRLRRPYDTVVLWCDAVCINQEDINERNHQVMQMGRIYSQATHVNAWLGDPSVNPWATGAKQAVKTINGAPQIIGSRGLDWMSTVLSELSTITRIFDFPYWKRLWIIQELVLADNIIVHVGDDSFTWKSMERFQEHVDKISRTSKHDPTAQECARALRRTMPSRLFREWLETRQAKRSDRNIYDLCLRYNEADCEDPRDKMFGLLGIAPDCCQKAVRVDYSLNAYQIAGSIINHHATSHIYDSEALAGWDVVGGKDLSSRSQDSVLKSCQIFLRVMKIEWAKSVQDTMFSPQWLTNTYGGEISRIQSAPSVTDENVKLRRSLWIPGKKKASSWNLSDFYKKQTSTDPSSILQKPSISYDAKRPILVGGTLLGRFVYTSIRNGAEDIWEDQGSFAEVKETAFFSLDQPSQSYQLTAELDVVCGAPAEDSRIQIPHGHLPNVVLQPGIEDISGDQGEDNSKAQIWAKYRQVLANNFKDFTVAIEEHGHVVFVPKGTLPNDLLCLFPMTDIIAVVRITDPGVGEILGRAITVQQHKPDVPLPFKLRNGTKQAHSVLIAVGSTTLQILARDVKCSVTGRSSTEFRRRSRSPTRNYHEGADDIAFWPARIDHPERIINPLVIPAPVLPCIVVPGLHELKGDHTFRIAGYFELGAEL